MREILFRGKGFYDDMWYEGQYYEQENAAFILINKPHTHLPHGYIYNGEEITIWGTVRVKPDTVSQWTRLTDKNGVKVFEGDIISGEPSMHTMKVEWYRACWCGRFKDFGCIYVEPLKLEADSTFDQFDVFVIGNKWDNPELMEE